MLNHLFGLIFRPRHEWQAIGQLPDEKLKKNLPYTLILALLPAIGWYVGTTQVGWHIDEDPNSVIRLAEGSALSLAAAFYLTMVIGVVVIGYFIHWMSHTYGADSNPIKGIVIAGFTATPIFVAGVAGAYPIFWVDVLLGTAAVIYAVYLLYIGIPTVMNIPQERGFLFASAIVAVALVVLIAVMGFTVIFWEFIEAPTFERTLIEPPTPD